MAITKDLGIVSAYGYAKSKGYTGTEEEFALLMADYAEVAGEAEAWAAGTKAGVPVPSTDPAYHNNAKYYADAAVGFASAAAGSASAAATDATDAHADAQSAATNAALAVNSATAAEASNNAAAGSATTASTKAGEASASATAAAGSATSAGQSAGTATTKAGEASASATAAAASAGAAASSVASLAHPYDATATYNIGDYVIYNGVLYRCTTAIPTAEAWTAAHWTAATLADDVEGKANPDGFYENMSVGNAEQLLASVYETEKVPYLFRTAGGSLNIGNRETDEIHGGSLAWNQLFDDTKIASGHGLTISVTDHVVTITGTPDAAFVNLVLNSDLINVQPNHVYYASGKLNSSQSDAIATFALFDSSWNGRGAINCETVAKVSSDTTRSIIRLSGMTVGTAITGTLSGLGFFDLTLMFGAQIADYIYTLEQSNAGAGVAYFRKLFPKPYYAYDDGGLKSVKTSAHRMTGFNQWDEEWELGTFDEYGQPSASTNNIRSKNAVKCFPSTSYYFTKPSGGAVYVLYYDAAGTYISYESIANASTGTVITTPGNCYFIKFYCGSEYGTTYKNDLCISLRWDGERDGEYEPYKLNEYALDSDLELRGIYKLDANNSLYSDGDIYSSDGTVRRRLWTVDLGAITWTYIAAAGSDPAYFNATKDSINAKTGKDMLRTQTAMMVCSKYAIAPWADRADKALSQVTNSIRVIDSSAGSDPAAFKAAMSGVYLIYELAEETEETADPYTNPQIVNDWGTEEYVDEREVAVPVGHVTQYMPDLKAKVEMSADSPDADGDYILRHSNGLNAYVPLTRELPAAPSEDGTYTLSVTVSGGVATYSWVSTS